MTLNDISNNALDRRMSKGLLTLTPCTPTISITNKLVVSVVHLVDQIVMIIFLFYQDPPISAAL